MVIACGDDPYMHTLQVNPQIYYYGLEDDNDIQAKTLSIGMMVQNLMYL